MVDDSALLRAMLDACNEREQAGGRARRRSRPKRSPSYGCVEPVGEPVDGLVELRGIVEKPKREEAPSNLAVIGRYVFTPEIFDALDRIEPGAGGELQLTDAIALLIADQTVLGAICTFGRYDVGQKIDFLRANVELALDRPDLGPEFAAFLRELVQRRGSDDVIPLDDAQATVLDAVAPLTPRTVAAADALGLVLAEQVVRARAGAAVRQHRDGRLRGSRRRTPSDASGAAAHRRRARGRSGPDSCGRRRARRSAS